MDPKAATINAFIQAPGSNRAGKKTATVLYATNARTHLAIEIQATPRSHPERTRRNLPALGELQGVFGGWANAIARI
ncbi:MAG: hypothetical protein AAGN66_08015 [Acidobacteriota bacterium]